MPQDPKKRRSRKDITTQRATPSQVVGVLRSVLLIVWNVMTPILKKAGNRIIVEQGLPLARSIVTELLQAKLTGEEKRQVAVSRLKSALVVSGKIVEDEVEGSMLNWVIETAVNELKSQN
jgi:hypothetical protein